MQERSVRFTTRYAPPMEEVVEKLKEKLSGPQNAGELMSELCQKLGEYRLIQLVFLRPRILVRGHSILTILLTERKDETAAELLEISTSAHYYGDSGSHSYRREAEEVLVTRYNQLVRTCARCNWICASSAARRASASWLSA